MNGMDGMNRMKGRQAKAFVSFCLILSILPILFILSKNNPFPRMKISNQPDGPPKTPRFSAFSA